MYYNIYSEFYSVNKFRELKSMTHHGNNRLDHINRVSKLSFNISKLLKLDYVSCTRGALLHDFFTTKDIKRGKRYLRDHPKVALENSKEYFDINEIEEDIILKHMYPMVKGRPMYPESKVVCLSDKIVSCYEFFRYQVKAAVGFVFFLIIRH